MVWFGKNEGDYEEPIAQNHKDPPNKKEILKLTVEALQDELIKNLIENAFMESLEEEEQIMEPQVVHKVTAAPKPVSCGSDTPKEIDKDALYGEAIDFYEVQWHEEVLKIPYAELMALDFGETVERELSHDKIIEKSFSANRRGVAFYPPKTVRIVPIMGEKLADIDSDDGILPSGYIKIPVKYQYITTPSKEQVQKHVKEALATQEYQNKCKEKEEQVKTLNSLWEEMLDNYVEMKLSEEAVNRVFMAKNKIADFGFQYDMHFATIDAVTNDFDQRIRLASARYLTMKHKFIESEKKYLDYSAKKDAKAILGEPAFSPSSPIGKLPTEEDESTIGDLLSALDEGMRTK